MTRSDHLEEFCSQSPQPCAVARDVVYRSKGSVKEEGDGLVYTDDYPSIRPAGIST